MDADGYIVDLNEQTVRMFGYDHSELRGRRIEVLVPERFRGGHEAHRTGYIDDAHFRPMGEGAELFGLRKDGSEFPVDIALAPLTIDGGLHALATVRDATLRRSHEAQARRLAEAVQARRQALELNDEVVQGLVVAKMALESDNLEHARRVVGTTLESARAFVATLLKRISQDAELSAGDLVRERAADVAGSEDQGRSRS